MPLKVKMVGLMVNNQKIALDFYVNTLGFLQKTVIDMGEVQWISVVSPDSSYVELSLEPSINSSFPAAENYQKALKGAGIPATAFAVDDIHAEYERLKSKGVVFKSEPKDAGDGTVLAIFDDTVGNWIQMYETPHDRSDSK